MSLSLDIWNDSRMRRLDEIEAAHVRVGGSARGRRYATQQLNRGYALLLAAEFQGFCRDLHSECAAFFRSVATPAALGVLLQTNLQRSRQLDRGNATPGSIGADFGHFGIAIWEELGRRSRYTGRFNGYLEILNRWRNAIIHEDFANLALFGRGRDTQLHLGQVRQWRRACDRLAIVMDDAMRDHLKQLTGQTPW